MAAATGIATVIGCIAVVHAAAPNAPPAAIPVSVSINVTLAALHPAVTKGSLQCGVVVQTRSWVEAHRAGLTDFASVSQGVLGTAHYFGVQSLLDFPVVNRAFSGQLKYTTTLSPMALTDPATHAPFAPDPTALVACWLLLNGQPAAWDKGPGLQVVGSGNFTGVDSNPLVVAVATANGSVSTSSSLMAKGAFFVPGPVALVVTLPGSRSALVPPAAPGPPSPVDPNLAGPKASAPVLTAQLPPGSATAAVTPQTPQALNLPGTAPGAGVSGTPAAPATAPPPVASSLLPPAPPITGLAALSSNPIAHVLQWDCVKDEWLCGNSGTINAAGSAAIVPIYDYTISSQAPGATSFDPVTPSAPIAAFGDCVNPPQCTQAVVHIKASLQQYIAPNTTFRVVRADHRGKALSAHADFVYASPPQPQEPGSFSAAEPQVGQVSLSWTPVPIATGYVITEKGSSAAPTRVPNQPGVATNTASLNNVNPGVHTYEIASEYSVPVTAAGLPAASVLVHRVPPPRGVPFLTKNNGAGSEDAATKHLDPIGCVPGGDSSDGYTIACPSTIIDFVNLTTYYNGEKPALYANVTELALGRSVRCWENVAHGYYPWESNTLASVECLAANHGSLVGPATPDGTALAAAAESGTSFAAVYMRLDMKTRDMTFANFIPAGGVGELPDPNTTTISDAFKLAKAATLDSEGAKFLPHVCLPCHGGTYHPDTGAVTGATFLPVDPSLVVFSNHPGHDRTSTEEAIRQINADIIDSQPLQAVADYINGMYKGNVPTAPFRYLPVQSPGAVAQGNYVPDGWAQQADFFRKVVKPNCLMCHLAVSSPTLVFDSADKFFANKALLYAAVCVGHSMPNAELPYNNLWSSLGPSGTVDDGPAALLTAALGHNSCP